MDRWIKNFEELAKTEERRMALEIAETGLDAINTENVIKQSIELNGDTLKIKDKTFNLANFESIKVIGFGKASSKAAQALEQILGPKINAGTIIDKNPVKCEKIKTLSGTHPRPSPENFKATQEILKLAENPNEKDLFIVIVSGGGSALLCWPEEECEQGQKLYDRFLGTEKTINELNTIRKHLSLIKGGGLTKMLYPATIIGLIFSDIPGNHYEQVASGPTYKDTSVIEDAEKIITENNLGEFNLIETPKEDKYFEKVNNIVLVSNETALEAMAGKAKELGLEAKIISSEIYDTAEKTAAEFLKVSKPNTVLLGGGEIRLVININNKSGSGGRSSFLAMEFMKHLNGEVFVDIASDGSDNGASAGAIVDKNTKEKMVEIGLDFNEYYKKFNSHNFFEKLGDIIYTGPTGANVSDLMILLIK